MLCAMKREFHSVAITLAVVLTTSFAIHAQTAGQSPTPTPSPNQEKQEPDDRVYSAKEVDVKAKFIGRRDYPSPGNDCRDRVKLLVRIRAVLHKSGSVTEARVVSSSSCARYDEDAIRVVNKTKFTPAMKDGQPVSQSMQFEFSFHLL